MSAESIEGSAYHEAGHAVMAWRLGNPILERGVAIDGQGSGYCNTRHRVQPGELLGLAARGERAAMSVAADAASRDADEWLAGVVAERRFRRLGRLDDAALTLALARAVRWDPRRHLPDDLVMVLRGLTELRLARTGRFVGGYGMWGPADDMAIAEAYRAVERRVSGVLDDPETWRAVQAVAEALLEARALTAAAVEAIIASASGAG